MAHPLTRHGTHPNAKHRPQATQAVGPASIPPATAHPLRGAQDPLGSYGGPKPRVHPQTWSAEPHRQAIAARSNTKVTSPNPTQRPAQSRAHVNHQQGQHPAPFRTRFQRAANPTPARPLQCRAPPVGPTRQPRRATHLPRPQLRIFSRGHRFRGSASAHELPQPLPMSHRPFQLWPPPAFPRNQQPQNPPRPFSAQHRPQPSTLWPFQPRPLTLPMSSGHPSSTAEPTGAERPIGPHPRSIAINLLRGSAARLQTHAMQSGLRPSGPHGLHLPCQFRGLPIRAAQSFHRHPCSDHLRGPYPGQADQYAHGASQSSLTPAPLGPSTYHVGPEAAAKQPPRSPLLRAVQATHPRHSNGPLPRGGPLFQTHQQRSCARAIGRQQPTSQRPPLTIGETTTCLRHGADFHQFHGTAPLALPDGLMSPIARPIAQPHHQRGSNLSRHPLASAPLHGGADTDPKCLRPLPRSGGEPSAWH